MNTSSINTAELNRRLENLLRLGTIAEVDEDARVLRVASGALTTDWLPWPADIGRNYKRWMPLRLGTQVILGSISGDPAQALIIGMLYTEALNSPSTDPDIDLIAFDDGTLVQHNSNSHKTTISSAGDVEIISPSQVTLNCPTLVTIDSPQTNVTGQLTVAGLFTYQAGMAGSGGGGVSAQISGNMQITGGDVSVDGISVKGHTHPENDGGSTGVAQ